MFSDGIRLGARLDRNGLRPARYWETSDGYAYMASEVMGDTISSADNVVVKGRLGPGKTFESPYLMQHLTVACLGCGCLILFFLHGSGQTVYVDLETGKFMENASIAQEVATKQPYKEWLAQSKWLKDISPPKFMGETTMESSDLIKLQASHGVCCSSLCNSNAAYQLEAFMTVNWTF